MDTLLTEYKIDMEPGGMPAMTAPIANLPNPNGMYVFEVSPVMAGKWALRLVAKVDHGHQTLRQTIVVDLLQ